MRTLIVGLFACLAGMSLRYEPQKVIPITPIAAVSSVMTVHPSNPANTPLEVVAAAKARRPVDLCVRRRRHRASSVGRAVRLGRYWPK
jgi:hypothetical protein